MANIKKAYARRDYSGRIIESSIIRRTRMPKFGNWVEVIIPDCCVPSTGTATTCSSYIAYGSVTAVVTLSYTDCQGERQSATLSGAEAHPFCATYYSITSPGTVVKVSDNCVD